MAVAVGLGIAALSSEPRLTGVFVEIIMVGVGLGTTVVVEVRVDPVTGIASANFIAKA